MNETPISIVISGSHSGDIFRRTLERALAQSLAPAEIIIASASCLDVKRWLSGLEPTIAIPIRLLSHGNPPSVAADLNAAIPAARSDLIALITPDSCWDDNTLQLLCSGIGAQRWSFSCPAVHGRDDPLRAIVERGFEIEHLLFPAAMARSFGELDAGTSPLEFWDLALHLSLQAPGQAIAATPITRSRQPVATLAAAAQVLRKHAPRLGKQLGDYESSARLALQAFADDEAQIRRAETSIAMPALSDDWRPGSNLAFLISTPRSGSTLLQQILAGHPDIHSLPEPWLMLNPCHSRRGSVLTSDYEPKLTSQALDGFLSQISGGDAVFTDAVRAMSDRLYNAALVGSGKRIFLDKTPRYFHILPELREIYPAARYVFLLRHPLAVLSSCLNTWFDGDVETFTQNKNMIDCFEGPRRIFDTISALGDAAVRISYERLVADPSAEIERLCGRIGIGFDASIIDYGASTMPNSQFGDQTNLLNFDRPVTNFTECWHEHMRDPEIAGLALKLLDHLGEAVFRGLGYDFDEASSIVATAIATREADTQSADQLTVNGEQFFAEGDLNAAKQAFEQALRVNPQFATAHNNLGVLSAQLGDTDAAMSYFIAALDSDPTERNALINLIDSAITINRLGETLAYLARYMDAVPDDAEIAGYATEVANAVEAGLTADDPIDREPETPIVESLPRAPILLIPNQQPRMSIITPSFNQGEYLEACIDSILSQNYPNLEYIIMDGGSTDQSVSIIKRYQKYLSHWQSQPDDGQYAAIEAGLKRSTGDIMAWLNSDDKYHPDALWKVSYAFTTRPQVEWLTGLYTFWDQYGTLTGVLDPVYWSRKKQLDANELTTIQQESTFWRRSLWDKAGASLATELYYAGDWDLWTRFFAHAKLHTLEWTLGGYRYHEGQKVGNDARAYTVEAEQLREREVAAIAAHGLELVDETPHPIRLDDPALIELAEWRETSQPVLTYRSRCTEDKPPRRAHRKAAMRMPSISIVTSLRPEAGEEQASAVRTWLDAGWRVSSVNAGAAVDGLRSHFPDITFIATDDVAHLENGTDAIKLSSLLGAVASASEDYIGIIKPDVIIDAADKLSATVGSYPEGALVYGDKLAVNSTAVLDGIADGYGYFFCDPKMVTTFTPGELTFGQDWWVHWLLMSAIAKGHPVHKIEEVHAYRIRKYIKAVLAEQIISSRACISSILAQYLPSEFRAIPSLKLSFDIETSDFEKFARSYIASHAA